MELVTEGLAKGTAGKVHQANCAAAALDGEEVTGGKLANDLPVGAQDGLRFFADDRDLDAGGAGQNQGTIGEGVGADWGDLEDLGGREDDRAASRQGISGRAGG